MNSYRFKEIRVRRGYSQKKISEIIGTSRETYVMYENGRVEPRLSTVLKLSEFYDLSSDYILGLIDIPYTLSIRKKTIIKPGRSVEDKSTSKRG